MPDRQTAASPPLDADVVRWTVHPAGRNPARAAVIVAVIAVAGLLSWRVSGAPLFAVLCTLILGGSLRAYFLPRTYVLDGEGASESGPLCTTRVLPWHEIRAVTRARLGLYLSPRLVDSRVLPDRGLFLRMPPDRSHVEAFVDAHRIPS